MTSVRNDHPDRQQAALALDGGASGVGVVDKSVAILDALRRGPHDLADLQRSTGMPRATAHRLAVALEHHQLVRRDGQGRFCLGFELIRLGRAAADEFPLAEVATPALIALRDRTGESVQLYVLEHDARRCVVSLQSQHALQWIVPVGARLPLEVGSAGKVLAAAPGSASTGLVAESVEEREPGVASVSAAVLDRTGAVVAAVSVSGPVERLSRAPAARFGGDVHTAARQISAVLGG
jgi:DNA-binding IclR family transcriptional regulator